MNVTGVIKFQNEIPTRIDPIIAEINPAIKKEKLRKPLISLYKNILHNEATIGGPDADIG